MFIKNRSSVRRRREGALVLEILGADSVDFSGVEGVSEVDGVAH